MGKSITVRRKFAWLMEICLPLFIVFGCRGAETVAVDSGSVRDRVEIRYVDRYDSVYIDRWHTVYAKGDTVTVRDSVVDTRYRYVVRTDTQYVHDTVRLTETSTVTKVEREPQWWPVWLAGIVLAFALFAGLMLRFYRAQMAGK